MSTAALPPEPPEEFICPLSLEIMVEPVICESGQTYEHAFIAKWIADKHNTCPKTRLPLVHKTLFRNVALELLISEWCKEHGVVLNAPSLDHAADGVDSVTATLADTASNALPELTGRGASSIRNRAIQKAMQRSEVNSLTRTESSKARVRQQALDSQRRQMAMARQKKGDEAQIRKARLLRSEEKSKREHHARKAVEEAEERAASLSRRSTGDSFSSDRSAFSIGSFSSHISPSLSEDFATGMALSSRRSSGNGSAGGGAHSRDTSIAFSVDFDSGSFQKDLEMELGSMSRRVEDIRRSWAKQIRDERRKLKQDASMDVLRKSAGRALAADMRPAATSCDDFVGDASRRSYNLSVSINVENDMAEGTASVWPGRLALRSRLFSMPRDVSVDASSSETSNLGLTARSPLPSSTNLGRAPGAPINAGAVAAFPSSQSTTVNEAVSLEVAELVETIKNPELPEDQAAAVAVLRVMSRSAKHHGKTIVSAGGLPPLLQLLSNEDPATVENAVSCIFNLSLEPNLGEEIIAAEPFNGLMHALEHGLPAAKANASAALFNLSANSDEAREVIVGSGALSLILDLMENGSVKGKKDAASLLVSLCLCRTVRSSIAKSGAIALLVELLQQPNMEELEEQAAAIFAALSRDQDGKVSLFGEGAIFCMGEMLEGGSEKTKEWVCQALLGLGSGNSAYLNAIDGEGISGTLDIIARTKKGRLKEKAQSLLNLLRENEV